MVHTHRVRRNKRSPDSSGEIRGTEIRSTSSLEQHDDSIQRSTCFQVLYVEGG